MSPFHFHPHYQEETGGNRRDNDPDTTRRRALNGDNIDHLDSNRTDSPAGNVPFNYDSFPSRFASPFSPSPSPVRHASALSGAGGLSSSSNIANQLDSASRPANGATNDNPANKSSPPPPSQPQPQPQSCQRPQPPQLSLSSAMLSAPRSLSFALPIDSGCHSAASAGGNTYPKRSISRRRSRRSTVSSGGRSDASAFLSRWMSNSNEDIPAAQPDDEGQIVGNDYVVGRQIGFGGFSTVKEAHRVSAEGTTETVAVKVAKKGVATATEGAGAGAAAAGGNEEQENDRLQAELDHEIQIWRTLAHANILPLEAVHETDYATFLFSPLVEGGTLFDLIKKNRNGLGLKAAKGYSIQIARALRYLHEDVHVVHRDIKLENCLLRFAKADDNNNNNNNNRNSEGHRSHMKDGIGDSKPNSVVDNDVAALLLCDFGMSQWIMPQPVVDPDTEADDQAGLSNNSAGPATFETAGSLEYASPEMLSSRARQSAPAYISPAVDIWAFGVILFCLIVGSRPFNDTFAPRIQTAIIGGEWDRDAILRAGRSEAAEGDAEGNEGEVRNALELIEGCLQTVPSRRFTIDQVLASEWFRGLSEEEDDDGMGVPRTAWG